MARINTNVSSLIAQNNLSRSNDDLQVRLERLSTGLRINRGADDPAGLIVSERLRSEIEGLDQAIGNAERATNVIATAEASLAEVANLLTNIKGLIVEGANTGAVSDEEIEANQLEIDDAVDSISRIANTTSFAGLKLLNGSLDFVTQGVTSANVNDVKITQANFGTADTMPVSVETVNEAEKAELFLEPVDSGGTALTELDQAATIEIAGNQGVQTLQFAAGTDLTDVQTAVNRISDSTGVEANLPNANTLRFSSSEFGSDQFVSVRKIPGTSGGGDFENNLNDAIGGTTAQRDTGVDVEALINGSLALGDGTSVKLNSSALDIELDLTESFATATPPQTENFTITGGGALYQLGPQVQSSQQLNFGIQSIGASSLGDAVTGFLNSIVSGGGNSLLASNAAEASKIVDKAITQVATQRGRLGALERNTLQTNVRSLQIALENVTASESQIRDADFAEETSKLTRAQLLNQVGTNVLATANNNAQNVLQLLQ